MIEAVDLFAGTGWGVALKRLGIREHGVELMPEAIATREANGMRTWMRDVWDVLETAPLDSPEFRSALMIASPPCQTFSMAGSGKGRAALDEVVGLIHSRAYLHPHKLREFGERHDPRTALVLTPLAYVARHVPTFVVFEQVPTVLPVWEACAEVMRRWGYSVWVGNLQAEMYGVPQTRKRAVLIARADGKEAKAPIPTHSRYYDRDPERLDNHGVAPWVSMAEALGWGMTARPYLTISGGANDGTPGGHTGGQDPGMLGGSAARARVAAERAAGRWVEWTSRRPSTTVLGDGRIFAPGHKTNSEDRAAGREYPGRPEGAIRVTPEEAATLQSYPSGFEFKGGKGKVSLQIGNAVPPLLAEAILREVLT